MADVPPVAGRGGDALTPTIASAATPLTEAQWQRQLTDLAELHGWTWAHFRPARTEEGWRTPVAGPGGRGFPDLVLWRERVVYVEVKSQRGRTAPHQQAILLGLIDAGAEVYVWRPSDFDEARRVLAHEGCP